MHTRLDFGEKVGVCFLYSSASFDPLLSGLFERVVQINLFSQNASGFNGALSTFNLTFKGAVSPSTVPAAVWMLGSGLLGLWGNTAAARDSATSRFALVNRETINTDKEQGAEIAV